jgi:hypothetical protein
MGSDQRSQCALCGQPGAKWIVKTNSFRKVVHKACGRTLAKSAPADGSMKVVVFPSKELKLEWQAKRFWTERFRDGGLDTATGRPVQS